MCVSESGGSLTPRPSPPSGNKLRQHEDDVVMVVGGYVCDAPQRLTAAKMARSPASCQDMVGKSPRQRIFHCRRVFCPDSHRTLSLSHHHHFPCFLCSFFHSCFQWRKERCCKLFWRAGVTGRTRQDIHLSAEVISFKRNNCPLSQDFSCAFSLFLLLSRATSRVCVLMLCLFSQTSFAKFGKPVGEPCLTGEVERISSSLAGRGSITGNVTQNGYAA